MTDVLSNGPLPLKLSLRKAIVDTDEQRINPGQRAAKPFNEVGEHPRWMNKGELPLRPRRTVRL
jgi:hypothetical protein